MSENDRPPKPPTEPSGACWFDEDQERFEEAMRRFARSGPPPEEPVEPGS
jgi:hypothetical protein